MCILLVSLYCFNKFVIKQIFEILKIDLEPKTGRLGTKATEFELVVE